MRSELLVTIIPMLIVRMDWGGDVHRSGSETTLG